MMPTPLHSRAALGLMAPRGGTSLHVDKNTGHYGGDTPWGSADRSTAQRFYETTDHNRCATIWRAWQSFHMLTRGWVDLAYNSGVCPHGHRYEGRGKGRRSAANGTNIGNSRSYAIVYIAGGNDPLTDQAITALRDEERRIATIIYGHKDWKSTACPGSNFYHWIKSGKKGGVKVPTAPASPSSGTPLLRVGSRGKLVEEWQIILVGANLLKPYDVDGIFGPHTEGATKRFQKMLGVTADGIVGQDTRRATDQLFRYLKAANAKKKPARAPSFPGTIRRGSRGPAVTAWQTAFRQYRGYSIISDGIAGLATNHVIWHFQRVTPGLIADGIAGPATWKALTS